MDRTYLRISLATEESGSIDKQRSQLERRADPNHVEYVDESVSGSKIRFAERPQGKRLLADLRPGDRLLVTKIDRLCRNVRDLLDLVELLEERDCALVVTEQAIDTSGAMGRFLLTLLGAIAELEAAMLAERRIETLKVLNSQGRWTTGVPPRGLRSVDNPDGGGKVPAYDPVDGPLVAEAIRAWLAGATGASQAEALGMSASVFYRLARNPLLAEHGVITWTEHERLLAMKSERRPWTRTGGIGEAVTCYACEKRLYVTSSSSRGYRRESYQCGAGNHKELDVGMVAMSRPLLEKEIADLFLTKYGDLEVIEEQHVDDPAHGKAVHEARTALETAQAAFLTATDDDEALERLRACKAALRAAEQAPRTSTTTYVETGRTFAEVWAEADDLEKVRLLRSTGQWVVWPPKMLESGRVEHVPSARPAVIEPWS